MAVLHPLEKEIQSPGSFILERPNLLPGFVNIYTWGQFLLLDSEIQSLAQVQLGESRYNSHGSLGVKFRYTWCWM